MGEPILKHGRYGLPFEVMNIEDAALVILCDIALKIQFLHASALNLQNCFASCIQIERFVEYGLTIILFAEASDAFSAFVNFLFERNL